MVGKLSLKKFRILNICLKIDEIIEMMKYQNAHEDGGSISRVRRRDPTVLSGIGYPLSLVKSTLSLTVRLIIFLI